MKLRAKKPKKKYKDLEHYLDAVYKNNKTAIDEKIPSSGRGKSSKVRFKAVVKEKMSQGMSAKKALDAVGKSQMFTSRTEHYAQNLITFMKKDKGTYHEFRQKKGWRKKLDLTKFTYKGSNGSYQIYEYDNSVRIFKQQSPKDDSVDSLIIEKIQEEDMYEDAAEKMAEAILSYGG